MHLIVETLGGSILHMQFPEEGTSWAFVVRNWSGGVECLQVVSALSFHYVNQPLSRMSIKETSSLDRM